jgi:hypothetical protein
MISTVYGLELYFRRNDLYFDLELAYSHALQNCNAFVLEVLQFRWVLY